MHEDIKCYRFARFLAYLKGVWNHTVLSYCEDQNITFDEEMSVSTHTMPHDLQSDLNRIMIEALLSYFDLVEDADTHVSRRMDGCSVDDSLSLIDSIVGDVKDDGNDDNDSLGTHAHSIFPPLAPVNATSSVQQMESLSSSSNHRRMLTTDSYHETNSVTTFELEIKKNLFKHESHLLQLVADLTPAVVYKQWLPILSDDEISPREALAAGSTSERAALLCITSLCINSSEQRPMVCTMLTSKQYIF